MSTYGRKPSELHVRTSTSQHSVLYAFYSAMNQLWLVDKTSQLIQLQSPLSSPSCTIWMKSVSSLKKCPPFFPLTMLISLALRVESIIIVLVVVFPDRIAFRRKGRKRVIFI